MAFIKGIKCYKTHVAEQINFELSELHQSIVTKVINLKKSFLHLQETFKRVPKMLSG